MNKQLDQNHALYTPQEHKNFDSALMAFFEQECPQMGGRRTRQVLVQSICNMRGAFFPETSHLAPGQTTWVTVHKDARPAYGKSIDRTELTSVVLDLVLPDEARQRAEGKKLRDIKIEATGRLFEQAYRHDGVLTNAEVAILLKIAPGTVGKYIRQWEDQHEKLLPRRGVIHDMGPTLTHKRIIIHKLFIEQHTVQQVARETNHSFEAIQRYIGTFRRVLLCRQKGMNTQQIASVIRHTPDLVKEYEAIIDQYGEQNEDLYKMLNFHPDIK